MTDFIPPKPPLMHKRPNVVKRFLTNTQSSLNTYTEKSYTMKMGEIKGLTQTLYFLVQPNLVKQLLASPQSKHPKSQMLQTLLQHLIGEGIFSANGPTWERRRGMVNDAFGAANIAKTFPHMLEAAQDLKTHLDTLPTDIPQRVDLLTTHVAADIIFRTLFSEPLSRTEAHILFEAFDSFQHAIFAHSTWMMSGLPGWLSPFQRKSKPFATTLRNALAKRVDARLAQKEAQQPLPVDLLTALMDTKDTNGIGFTRDELIDEVAVMFLAGHETSASALAWGFYLIAHHPDIQTRLQAEITDALQGETLTPAHFRKLPLVRDVFRETLRLYPPIAFVPRKTTQPEQWRDKFLKTGSSIFVPLWLLHRQKNIWVQADHSNPDRFSTPEGKTAMRDAYLPFSMGPRVCIGASFAMQEAAIVMATLLQHYTFLPDPEHTPIPIAKLTLRSKNGISLFLKKQE